MVIAEIHSTPTPVQLGPRVPDISAMPFGIESRAASLRSRLAVSRTRRGGDSG